MKSMISLEDYERKKNRLCVELLATKNVSLGKSTSNLFRHTRSSNENPIDVRHFNNVIAINPDTFTADVEGMTTYETLLKETLKFGLMPAVVPEFKTITVGGATAGIGLEASSFKFGFVHETVQEIEVLLSDGQTLNCSKSENADLFFGFPNSYGTLGYALRLRIQLVSVLPFVKIIHHRFINFDSYFNGMKNFCAGEFDFIDGTIFNKNEMYITTGTFVKSALSLSDYSYMNIYYKSIRVLKEDCMTTLNFMWRWDTDWYWNSTKFGAQFPLVRYLLGPKRLRSSFYWKLRKRLNDTPFWKLLTPFINYETVVQDVDIPIENAAEFMEFQTKNIGIRPIWTCPVKSFKGISFPLYPLSPSTTYVNIGFWNIKRTTREPGFYNRLIEEEVTRLNGRKILYSDSFYTQVEFDTLYGGSTYAGLKSKYDSRHSFKTLYEVCVKDK